MNIRKAVEIIDDYGAVLEKKGDSHLVVAPLSMLPYPKNEIKAAIKYALWCPEFNLTAKWRNDLEVGFTMLADFMEDEYASLLNSFHESVAKMAESRQSNRAPNPDFNTDQKIIELNNQIYQESQNLLEELRAMPEIITYKNQGSKGMYSQVKLSNGDRILISIAQTGVKISKMVFFGFWPVGIIWRSKDMPRIRELFGDPNQPQTSLLDAIIMTLIDCKSISDVEGKLGGR